MIDITPWSPYLTRTSLTSAGRTVLTAAFADVINICAGIEANELPEIFAASADDGEIDACRHLVQLIAERTAEQFVRGRIATFARPLEGGEITPLDPSLWEIDDPIGRFATGVFNLDRWADPHAEPSHRLFVDNATFNGWLVLQRPPSPISARALESYLDPSLRAARSLAASNGVCKSDQVSCEIRYDAIPATYCFEESFDAIDLAEVERRTSLSGSTIYSHMKQGKFPQNIPLTANRVVWSSTEVNQWIAEKAARRSH